MLQKKIKAVEKILLDAEKQTSAFSVKNNLVCIKNCGQCCSTQKVGASSLEFLPAGYELYKQHKLYAFIELLQQKKTDGICIFFNPFLGNNGNCSMYLHRGLICRLFGFSKRWDKNSEPGLITCSTLKSTPAYQKLLVQNLYAAPTATDYYTRLSGIDLKEANNILPVNEAIQKALEEVAMYFNYRRKKPA